jgi:F0F1-type ATP synthase membrane subunit b/b'
MAGSGLPQLNVSDFEPQIIWLVVLFFIFYLFIKVKVSPYFYAETENRDLFIENNYSEAKKLQKKADNLAEEHSEKIKEFHLNASKIVLDARQTASKRIEEEKVKILNKFDKDIEDFSSSLDSNISAIENSLETVLVELNACAADKLGLKSLKSVNDNHFLDKTKAGGV